MDAMERLNVVRGQVGRRPVAAGEARTVAVRQRYDTNIGDLTDACTNPVRIPRWLLPNSGELRLGARSRRDGNAGGTIERCAPPHWFSARWEDGGEASGIDDRRRPRSPSEVASRHLRGRPPAGAALATCELGARSS